MAQVRELHASPLLERDAELEIVTSAISAARVGSGAVALVEGPAGIGKTRILRAAREVAGQWGCAVLSARGSDLEREFRWGVVRQLLEAPLASATPDERRELLTGAAGLAAPLVAPGDGGAAEPETGPLLHGLYWLCVHHAMRRPTVLVVDDAQWADPASLRFLVYLAHRIDELALGMVIAVRPGESAPGEELLAALALDPAVSVVRPAPLSEGAAVRLLAGQLGTDPAPAFAAACMAVTRGNPFLLVELARAAAQGGLPASAEAAEQVADLGPRSVALAITRRVRGLASGALDLAVAVAVLGPGARLRHAATLAELAVDDAASATDALTAAAVLTAGDTLEFVHPLVRAAIYADVAPGERSRLHGRAARMFDAEGGPAERAAAHLLCTHPSGDVWTVGVLRAAAAAAMAKGAPEAAARYLSRALDEPPPAADLAEVHFELGRAEAVLGRSASFEHHLRRALSLFQNLEDRLRAALALGRAHTVAGYYGRGAEVYLAALEEAAGADSPTGKVVESELIQVAMNDYGVAAAASPYVARRLEQAERGGLDDPSLMAATALAMAALVAPAHDAAKLALAAAECDLPETTSGLPGCIGNALLFAGELKRAGEHFLGALAKGRAHGSRLLASLAGNFAARVLLELGEARRAEEEARLGLELLGHATSDPGPVVHGYLTAHLALVLLERGSLEEVEDLLGACEPIGGTPATYPESMLLCIRGRVRLAQGRPADALDLAVAAGGTVLDTVNPAVLPWRSDAARALAALGRPDEGAEHAARELELARSHAVPHAIACALRGLAACRQRVDASAEILEEAIGVVQATPARLELARATVELGAVLRRAGRRRAAVEHLRVGLDLAHRAGATALAERARGELVTAGARPRRALLSGADALTASERRVADLAAAGHTNQEIAQALFVTTRTVEAHLTRAFRKLDVRGRGELRAALSPTP